MREKIQRIFDVLSITFWGALAVLFIFVLVTSVVENMVDMLVRVGSDWRHPGNYMGLLAGFVAYGLFIVFMRIPRMGHNLNWFMKFTHELTHTLVAVLFFAKIREFVVRDRECYVNYQTGFIGYVPITLSPYCIPIYTFMLFPFRFVGDSAYMVIFDFLIAFTYAFHVHAFIRQTKPTQSDIKGCGFALSTAFISFVHLSVLSLICATPKGGVLNALSRVFWEYPSEILCSPVAWYRGLLAFIDRLILIS